MTTVSKFLGCAGFSQEFEPMIDVVDESDGLVLLHYNDEGKTHPVARTIRGYIYSPSENKVIVEGESDYEDVMLTDELIEELDPAFLCVGRQLTHVRAFVYGGKLHFATNKKLDYSKSYWGLRMRSFRDMLAEVHDPLTLFNENSNNRDGVCDFYIEAPDNQMVVNEDVGEVTRTKVYTRADLLSFNLEHSEKPYEAYSIDQDIVWVDYQKQIRYLSPSMWEKMHTIRNLNEPNLVRRLFILKGSAPKLVSVMPQDQKTFLREFLATKTSLVDKLLTTRPRQVVEIAKNQSISLQAAFYKLPGITQYRLLFEPEASM